MLGCHGERKLALEGLFFLLSLLPLGKWAAHAHRPGAFTRRSLRVSSVSLGGSPEAGEAVASPGQRLQPAPVPRLQPGAGATGAALASGTALGMGQVRPRNQPTRRGQGRHGRSVCRRQLFLLPSQSFAM